MGGVHSRGAVGGVREHMRPVFSYFGHDWQEAFKLKVDGSWVFRHTCKVGHHSHQFDLGDMTDRV